MKSAIVVFIFLTCATVSGAQHSHQQSDTATQETPQGQDMSQMPGMQMDQDRAMNMQPQSFIDELLRHDSMGTSAQPDSTPVPMLMKKLAQWNVMFHANVFALDEQQSGPRGADKFFSTNWLMGMAQRHIGPGTFTARAMFSLEPGTITDRQYPLLFQQGETAFGRPIVDGQHPHNFFMELGVLYDIKLGTNSLLSFYFAPVGDPAIGPTAFPHRASASENPLAPIGHHQEDSTHISEDVATAGLAYRIARIEASGFHGREPAEFRWDVDQGRIDSWSVRLTLQPGKDWSGQYSYARIASPEALFPTEDQERMTASVMYNRPLRDGNWANTLVWGRTRSLADNSIFNSYLFESTLRFRLRNYAWTRIESAERSNELLLGENPLPPGFEEMPIGQVQAYTVGYDRDFPLVSHMESAIGAQFTTYGIPNSLNSIYGRHPVGVALVVRLRPVSDEGR